MTGLDRTNKEVRSRLIRAGFSEADANTLMEVYIFPRTAPVRSIKIPDNLKEEELSIDKEIPGGVDDPSLWGIWGYLKDLRTLEGEYNNSKDWPAILNLLDIEDPVILRVFIDFVEDKTGEIVKDGKHLKKLLGVKESPVDLQTVFIKARADKYLNRMEWALIHGAMYEDLLKIKPADFGLPEEWEGSLATNQRTAIRWAIIFVFGEDKSITSAPDPRMIAEEINAPLSVVLDALLMV